MPLLYCKIFFFMTSSSDEIKIILANCDEEYVFSLEFNTYSLLFGVPYVIILILLIYFFYKIPTKAYSAKLITIVGMLVTCLYFLLCFSSMSSINHYTTFPIVAIIWLVSFQWKDHAILKNLLKRYYFIKHYPRRKYKNLDKKYSELLKLQYREIDNVEDNQDHFEKIKKIAGKFEQILGSFIEEVLEIHITNRQNPQKINGEKTVVTKSGKEKNIKYDYFVFTNGVQGYPQQSLEILKNLNKVVIDYEGEAHDLDTFTPDFILIGKKKNILDILRRLDFTNNHCKWEKSNFSSIQEDGIVCCCIDCKNTNRIKELASRYGKYYHVVYCFNPQNFPDGFEDIELDYLKLKMEEYYFKIAEKEKFMVKRS